jgi:uncharacterized membrane protein
MFDLAMLFLFSFTGLALGLLSIQRTEQWFLENRSSYPMAKLRVGVFLLCGFGIYLGRVERWNSWDILTNPSGLFSEIMEKLLNPFANMETWGTTILFALLLWLSYSMLKTMPATANNPRKPTPQ